MKVYQLSLTEHELEFMKDALEDFKSKGSEGLLMGSLFGAILSGGNEEIQEKMKEREEKERAKWELERKIREREIEKLKAKLVLIEPMDVDLINNKGENK